MNHVYYLILTERGRFLKSCFTKERNLYFYNLFDALNFLLLTDHFAGVWLNLANKSVLLFTCRFILYISLWSFNRLSVSLSTAINSLDAYKPLLENIAGLLFSFQVSGSLERNASINGMRMSFWLVCVCSCWSVVCFGGKCCQYNSTWNFCTHSREGTFIQILA